GAQDDVGSLHRVIVRQTPPRVRRCDECSTPSPARRGKAGMGHGRAATVGGGPGVPPLPTSPRHAGGGAGCGGAVGDSTPRAAGKVGRGMGEPRQGGRSWGAPLPTSPRRAGGGAGCGGGSTPPPRGGGRPGGGRRAPRAGWRGGLSPPGPS